MAKNTYECLVCKRPIAKKTFMKYEGLCDKCMAEKIIAMRKESKKK